MICILNCEELVGRQQRARFMGVTTLLWMLRGPKEASKIYGDVQAAWGNGGKTLCQNPAVHHDECGFKTYMYIVSTMKKRTIAIWWRKPNNDYDDDGDDDDDDDDHDHDNDDNEDDDDDDDDVDDDVDTFHHSEWR